MGILLSKNASDAQDKKLTPQEIADLQKAGHDPHDLKGDRSGLFDLFKKPNGDIVVKPKDGSDQASRQASILTSADVQGALKMTKSSAAAKGSGLMLNVRLIIAGQEDAREAITSVLGLSPSETWVPGDLVTKRTIHRHRRYGWMLRSPVNPTTATPEQAIKELLTLVPDLTALRKLPKGLEIMVSLGITGKTVRPSFELSSDVLEMLAKSGVTLDVDPYDVSFVEDEG